VPDEPDVPLLPVDPDEPVEPDVPLLPIDANDDVATNCEILLAPPTQMYPCDIDAVNTVLTAPIELDINKLPVESIKPSLVIFRWSLLPDDTIKYASSLGVNSLTSNNGAPIPLTDPETTRELLTIN
jgi:hypothetical protein